MKPRHSLSFLNALVASPNATTTLVVGFAAFAWLSFGVFALHLHELVVGNLPESAANLITDIDDNVVQIRPLKAILEPKSYGKLIKNLNQITSILM